MGSEPYSALLKRPPIRTESIEMSGLSRTGLIQSGDLVYFSCLSDTGEELVWTTSMVRRFEVLSKLAVSDPSMCVFQIESQNGPGSVIKPMDLITLKQLLADRYVAYQPNEVAFQAALDEKAAPLALSVATNRLGASEVVQDNDLVSLIAQSGDSEFILSHSFYFKGLCFDTFRIQRFEPLPRAKESTVRYGRVCKLRSHNDMYLSVRPNLESSYVPLLLEEDKQVYAASKAEICLPEYSGYLKADLTSEAEDGNNLWVIEREDRFRGGEVQLREDVYLKHLASGRYLKGDLTLQQRDSAGMLHLESVQQTEGTVGYGEFKSLRTGDSEVSQDYTQSLGSIGTQIFEHSLAYLSPNTVLRVCLTEKPASDPAQKLMFCVTLVTPEQSCYAIELAQLASILPNLRLALQNTSKLENAHQAIEAIANSIRTDLMFKSSPAEDYKGGLASDFQILNEILRLCILMKQCTVISQSAFEAMTWCDSMEYIVSELTLAEKAARSLQANTSFLQGMTLEAPGTFLDLIAFAVTSHVPSEVARIHWAEGIMNTSFTHTLDEYGNVMYCLHLLLSGMQARLMWEPILKANGEFTAVFSQDADGFRVRKLGEDFPLLSLDGEYCRFKYRAIKLAANFCSTPERTEEITVGMGLTAAEAVALYHASKEDVRLQLAFLYFIAEVHVPAVAKRAPLSNITKKRMLEKSPFLYMERLDWFCFSEPNSPIADLVKGEVYFWLSTVHVPMSLEELANWYMDVFIRFKFIGQLIEYREVSDLFVAAMISSAVALTWFALGTEVPGFSERFPNLTDSEYLIEGNQQIIAHSLLELLEVYQRWKAVTVMERCRSAQIVQIDRATLEGYLRELDFHKILSDFCSLHAITLSSDSGHLVSDDPIGIPTLVKNLDVLLRNDKISPEKIMIHLFQNTSYASQGNPSEYLDLIDNEIDMANCLLRFFSQLTDETAFQDYKPYVDAVQNIYVSPYQLETGSTVTSLAEYISALESLADFMQSLGESLANFQGFLERADFLSELERMWRYSAAIGPQFAEEPNKVKLRTLTFELSRLYAQGSGTHRTDLLQMMSERDFYPEYPEYLRLLMDLRVLKAGKQTAINLTRAILKSPKMRSVSAIKELLGNAAMKSQTIFTVIDCFQKKETLSEIEWEVLALVSKFIPVDMRLVFLSKMSDKWSTETVNIWKAGAFLMIYASTPSHHLFTESLSAITASLDSINTMDAKVILSHFNPRRCTEDLNHEVLYALELLFERDIGVVSLLKAWQDTVPLSELVKALAHFYLTMAEMLDLNSLKSALAEYAKACSEKLTPEETDMLERVAASKDPSFPLKAPSISSPGSIFSITCEVSSARSYLSFLNNTGKVTAEAFARLKEVFLSKKLELDYLHACKQTAGMISTAESQEETFLPVLEQCIDMVINSKSVKVKALALEVMTTIVKRVLGVRSHLLKLLGTRRLYMRFFGVLEGFIAKYLDLKRHLTKEANPILEKNRNAAGKVIQAFLALWQYCCDGCLKAFQHYLRSQEEGADINLISLVALLMAELLKDASNSSCCALISQCSFTLLEALSGPCVHNQRAVLSTEGFLESAQSIIENTLSKVAYEERFEILNSLVGLLLSLCEGRERNMEAMKPLTDKIQFKVFQELSSAYEQMLTEAHFKALSLGLCRDEEVKRKFNFALKCLILYFSAVESVQVSIKSGLLKFISFVEIQHQNSEEPQIRSLTFQVPFHAHYLTDRSATQLLFEIDRDSRQEKLDDFTTKVKVCEVEMLHQQRLSQLNFVKSITKHWKLYWYISYCFILTINLMLLLTVEAIDGQRMNIPPEEELLVLLCSLTQVSFILLGTASYYIEYWHTLRKPLQKRQESTEMEKLPSLPNPGSLEQSKVIPRVSMESPLNINQVVAALARLGYTLLACAAAFYPAVYPFLLLQILNFNDAVLNIFKSVTLRGSQLILTLIFSLMIIYMFTFIAYLFFYGYYNPEEGLYCDTLLDCFLSTVNLGMRSGGGIGDAFGPTNQTDFDYRLIFDLLFYISITTILMAIVFGIIVDTFSELRDARNEIESDMNNVCFICGQKRSVIEVRGEGWVVHTTMVHNPFAYMYFLLHLQATDDMDCSGIEREVKQNYQELNLSFYPTTSLAIGFRDVED